MNDTLLAVTVPPLKRTTLPELLFEAMALKAAVPESTTTLEFEPVTLVVPVEVNAPPATCSRAPPVEMFTVPGVNVAPGPTLSTPAVTFTVPVNVFVAPNTNVPAPALLRPLVPARGAAIVAFGPVPSGLTVMLG